MLTFYKSRELADRLNIPLAKWKRWSRAFLAPDPLGGLQSGYARQYHPDQAFSVLLGGMLVAGLKLSVPQARQVLDDLDPWLSRNGYRFDAGSSRKKPAPGVAKIGSVHHRLVFDTGGGTFRCVICSVTTRRHVAAAGAVIEDRYSETVISTAGGYPDSLLDRRCRRLVDITRLIGDFVQTLGIDPSHFSALA